MNLQVRRLSKADFYDTFSGWCASQEFTAPAPDMLPENVFVCGNENLDIYCVWLYLTDGGIAYLAWPCSPKYVDYGFKKGGLDFLFAKVAEYAHENNFKAIITTSGTQAVIDALKVTGYVDGDVNINQYIQIL